MAKPQRALLFTVPDAWSGGEYELALELGPADDVRARAVLEAVWSFPALDGCYLQNDVEPAHQPKIVLGHPPTPPSKVCPTSAGLATCYRREPH